MPTPSEQADDETTQPGVSRRRLMQGLAAAGLAGGAAAPAGAEAGADWEAFRAANQATFRRMGMVGAAVAVVSAERVLHISTYGVTDRRTNRPVTADTHFLVASTTKSMSSLLVATYVDQGLLRWDQPVIEAWPGFRAPTDALTRTLRVRDLLGMASGITEPPALSALHEGDPTAPQLLQSVVNLPVEHPPGTTFFYNNTLYAVGGYLPSLALGVAPADVEASYARQMHERVFRPAGMRTARVADDPRGLVRRYARGYGNDLRNGRELLPYGAVGSYAPVGGTLATLRDMAAYVRLQLRRGVSVDGGRVVSAANLAECWKPHVAIPTSPDLDPDAIRAGYAMGWIHETYRGGTSFVWHNGGIDGFTTLIGFLPGQDIGLVVLNNMNPSTIGGFFYLSVLNRLLGQTFGINVRAGAKVDAAYDRTVAGLRDVWNRSRPVETARLAPHAGHYQGGYRLVVGDGSAEIRIGARAMPLRQLPDGACVVASGLLLNVQVRLREGPDGASLLELEGLETVRRTVGFD